MTSSVPPKGSIIRDSVNQEAMIKKLERQYKDKEAKLLQSNEVKNLEEAKERSLEAIRRRANERRDPSYQPIKQMTVIKDPQSKEAQIVKDKIRQEEAPPVPASLKGRVTVAGQK